MANLNVTYEDLTSNATQMRNAQQSIHDQLISLQSAVTNLTSSGFQTDQASGAFQSSYDEFTTGANNAIEGLNGMASFLEQAAQAMQETDQQLASGIRG